jgi:ribosome-associated protein
MLLDLKELNIFTDYFVLCTGTSDRMLNALADSVLEEMQKHHKRKGKKEGLARDGWLVVDYGDVVVHLFSPDQRNYYQLEELWQDGKVLLRLQ